MGMYMAQKPFRFVLNFINTKTNNMNSKHLKPSLFILVTSISFFIHCSVHGQTNELLIPTIMESDGQVLNIKQGTFTQNMIRIRATESAGGVTVGEGNDMIEMVANELGNGQFIEMERNMPGGTIVVARINTDGSAEFKSIQYPDGTIQTTAAEGPLAHAAIKSSGTQTSGSSNITSLWDNVNKQYVIKIIGSPYQVTEFTTVVTPNSSFVNRFWTEDDGAGQLIVKFLDDNFGQTQSDFHFVVYQ